MAFADRASRAALGTESAQEVTAGLRGLWLVAAKLGFVPFRACCQVQLIQ